jgi:hypothetical protein
MVSLARQAQVVLIVVELVLKGILAALVEVVVSVVE